MIILSMNLLFSLLLIIGVLIGVAFLTLLEQKLLSYIQIRKGPNKVGLIGIMQPFCDAIKLFFKEYTIPVYSNYIIYYLTPIFSLILSLLIWFSFPFIFKYLSFKLSFIFLLSCMSLGVYVLMVSGWSSNSNYALLGSLRAIAQTVSYEVCMILMMLLFIVLILSFSLIEFLKYQQNLNFLYLNFLLSFIILVIFLAETNRAPFDFAEGESELVSGFNIEYSSGGFALIFLSEYSSILFLSGLFSLMFLFNSIFYVFFFLKLVFLSFIYIWVRGTYPRFRYDKLMYLTWKLYLTFTLNFLFLYFSFKIISL